MADDDRLGNVARVHHGNNIVRKSVHTEIGIRSGVRTAGGTVSALVHRDDPDVTKPLEHRIPVVLLLGETVQQDHR